MLAYGCKGTGSMFDLGSPSNDILSHPVISSLGSFPASSLSFLDDGLNGLATAAG